MTAGRRSTSGHGARGRGIARFAAVLALAGWTAACGGGETSEPGAAEPADSATAVVADTQYVVDSSGARLQIVTSRKGARVQEYRPRAGAGDPDQPGVFGSLEPADARSLMQAARPPWYVLDVRDARAYATEGRIPGALLVPLDALEANMDDLHVRTDQTVLVYGGPGDDGERAGRLLASWGFPRVRVLEGGFPAWKRAGLPVEGGS